MPPGAAQRASAHAGPAADAQAGPRMTEPVPVEWIKCDADVGYFVRGYISIYDATTQDWRRL